MKGQVILSGSQRKTNISRRMLFIGVGVAAVFAASFPFFFGRRKSMFATRIISPTSQASINGVLRIDFGRVWFGNLFISSSKPIKSKLTVRLGEKLTSDGRIDKAPPGTVRFYETSIFGSDKGIRLKLSDADMRGLVEYGSPAMPFRFAEIEGLNVSDFAVTLEAVVSSDYTQTGFIRFFGQGDRVRQLNRLVELGFRTIETTSFMGIFVDGDRERIPYEADAYINQLGWYVATSDISVPRRTLETLLKKPTWPSEWMIHLIFIAWADYTMTGDKPYLAKVIDRLTKFSLSEFIDQTGLVNTSKQPLNENFVHTVGADYLEDIVDWPKVERDGYDMLPYNTVVNAFVYQGQKLLSDMHLELGRPNEATQFRLAADKLRGNIVSKLIDPVDGLFLDGLGSKHKSAHATFFPLAFGLTPSNGVAQALEHINRRIAVNENGFPCSVYAAQYLLEGLFRVGAGKLALNLILNSGRRGWFNMLDVYDATVTHEAWDPVFKENIDWNHAWGTSFFNVLQRHVIGIRPTQPGWHKWTLEPQLDPDLSVEAKVPTPHGTIEVTISGSRKVFSVIAPAATEFVQSNNQINGWQLESIQYRD